MFEVFRGRYIHVLYQIKRQKLLRNSANHSKVIYSDFAVHFLAFRFTLRFMSKVKRNARKYTAKSLYITYECLAEFLNNF